MLSLKDNNTKDWPLGIRLVQQQKKNSHHSTIKCNPYFAVYGMNMNFSLSSTNILKQILENIADESELERVCVLILFYIILCIKIY